MTTRETIIEAGADEVTIALLIEIPEIYDGVSVYEMSDGSRVNRWTETLKDWPDDKGVLRRWERTEQWLKAHPTKAVTP